MTSLLKIGLILMAVTVLMVLVHPADADDDLKRKRVIIKIPHRVKHIYHHHTKKVHVHKKKAKPAPKKKKPHKHVHVVVEEEEIVTPIKSWKTIHSPFKGKSGWDDWKASPSGFKHSVTHPDDFGYSGESTHMEEDFAFEDDHDSRESRIQGRPHSYRGIEGGSSSGGGGKRNKKKGGRGSTSYRSHEEPSFEASYEIYHHHDQDQDFEGERPRRKPKSKMSSGGRSGGPRPNGGGFNSGRPTYRKTTSRPRFEDKYHEPDEYDELYERGPAYPERKEHPSWTERSRYRADHAGPDGVGSEQTIWNIPKIPAVNEFIDDVNDTPDPGVTYGNSGGFYPSAYNPITTITESVVENLPAVPQLPKDQHPPPNGGFRDLPSNNGFNNVFNHGFNNGFNNGYNNGFNPGYDGDFNDGYNNGFNPGPGHPPVPQQRPPPRPVVPTEEPAQQHLPVNSNKRKTKKKQKKNPGYLSQVSQTQEGLTVSYQSHIGHSSDEQSPSSSFQSVSYGGLKSKK